MKHLNTQETSNFYCLSCEALCDDRRMSSVGAEGELGYLPLTKLSGGPVPSKLEKHQQKELQVLPTRKKRSTLVIFKLFFSSMSKNQVMKKINLAKVKYTFKSRKLSESETISKF